MSDLLLPLGYAEQPRPPKRPTRHDESVKRTAAEMLLPEIISWLGDDWREAERNGYLDDLMQVVHIWDGYKAARELERRHWEADAQLVEILDGGGPTHVAEEVAVKAWVAANAIQPKFGLRDVVTTARGIGTIVRVDLERAQYIVQTADFLQRHPAQAGGTGGTVVAYEEVLDTAPASGDTSEPSNTETSLRPTESQEGPIPVFRPSVREDGDDGAR